MRGGEGGEDRNERNQIEDFCEKKKFESELNCMDALGSWVGDVLDCWVGDVCEEHIRLEREETER